MRAADIDVSFAPQQAPSTHTEVLDDEAVILDDGQNRLHHLNRTASVVWSCFDGSGPITDIARDLAAAFGTEPGTTTAEVLALARELGGEGLIAGVEPDLDLSDSSDPGT